MWIAALVLLAGGAQGCRKPAAPRDEPVKGAGRTEAEPEAPAPEPGGEGEVSGTCPGPHVRQVEDEARRRTSTSELEPMLRDASLRAGLVDLVQDVRAAASRRELGKTGAAVDRAHGSLSLHRSGTSEDEKRLMEAVVRSRLGAFATCRSLSDGDASWCSALDEAWQGERSACLLMHTLYVRIVRDAMRGGKPCDEAMKGSPALEGLDDGLWASVCTAVKERKPDGCPAVQGTRAGIICRVASSEHGEQECASLGGQVEGGQEDESGCCRKLAWRFANVSAGSKDAKLYPEAGALGGEAPGCERALVWGIFQDLARLFGIDDAPPPPHEGVESSTYLCRFQVYWSAQPLPGT